MLGKELLKLCHKAYVNWSSFFPEVKQTYKPLPNTYKYVIKPTTADKKNNNLASIISLKTICQIQACSIFINKLFMMSL